MAEAEAVLQAAADSRMHAYIVVSLLTGARTEELRALTWDHVDLDGEPNARIPVPPHVAVWRSVRTGVTPRPTDPGGLSPRPHGLTAVPGHARRMP